MTKFLTSTAVIIALAAPTALFTTTQANAGAGVFEVIHPDVKKGEVELEFLNGIGLTDIDPGDERSEHEFAAGWGVTDFWKLTFAVEIANPSEEGADVEGFEIENLLIIPLDGNFGSHDHDKGEGDGHDHDEPTLALFTAFELPREGGGAVEIGPVVEFGLGDFEIVGNLFAEIPFDGDEAAGIAFATQTVYPVSDSIGVGFEAFGEFEGAFGDDTETSVSIGPAVYYEHELPNGRVFEPRIGLLFGVTDEAPDAVLSFNIEYKFDTK